MMIVLAFCLASCGGSTEHTQPQSQFVTCKSPRPQICTMIYDPVCGTLDSGGVKNYASGCAACSDTTVIGYQKNECPN